MISIIEYIILFFSGIYLFFLIISQLIEPLLLSEKNAFILHNPKVYIYGQFMIEKLIYLEGIDPLVIYGVNNNRYERIRSAFPRLKLVARGNEIKAMGEKSEVLNFEKKVDIIISYFQKYNHTSDSDLDQILGDDLEAALKLSELADDVILYGNNGQPIKARTVNQKVLADDFKLNDLLFAIGPAGSGKTYTAIALAVMAFRSKAVKRIILTRPAVEAGEHLGFLPGDLKEKLDPYLQPLYDALHDMIPARKLESLMEDGTIQIAPLAFMRGRTLDHACVILDEAQNSTISQLKMFLTRMGKNAKFIVTGDLTQIDLPNKSNSGLSYALKVLKDIEGISMINFDTRDIIRHRLVKSIVDAYDKAQENQ
jgi:phosphate starvation-inducible protein PhoH and related proteins